MSHLLCLTLASFLFVAAAIRHEDSQEIHLDLETKGLESNQYYFRWVNRVGAQLVSLYESRMQAVPVVPIKCRLASLWLKIDDEDVASDPEMRITSHCVVVQCDPNKVIRVEKLAKCPFKDSLNYWDKDLPERLMYGSDPFLLEDSGSSWTVKTQGGRAYANGGEDAMTPDGPKVDSIDYEPEVKDQTWSQTIYNCDSKLEDRNPNDLPLPKDEASTAECNAQATEALAECRANAESFEGKTPWYWKQHLPPRKWNVVEGRYPECEEWCKKHNCKESTPPEDDTRATKKMFEFLNTWQYQCEQKLDKGAAESKRKCHLSGFCDDPDVHGCIKQSYLPYPY